MMFPILLLLFLVEPCYSFPASLEYTYSNCYNLSTYAVNSSFESNLNLLLSSLTQQILDSKNGFLTLKQGSPTDKEPAYGLALCRGDIAHFDCHQCLLLATSHAALRCPRANQVIVWEEDCTLRYSNQSFFSILQEKPYVPLHNLHNITSRVNDWNKVLNKTLSDVISSAATNKFATKEGLYLNKTLYTLAQCNPDLTNQDCTECFIKANSRFYDKIYVGGIVLTPSCTLRYEIYPFYNTTKPSSSSNFTAHAPTNLVAATNNPEKKRKYVSEAVIAIIVVSIVVIGMLFAILTFCLKKKSKKYKYPLLDVKNVLDDLTTAESLMFELTTLEAATNNFSDDRKLGQGGFGSVYQGTLPNGQEIAVKRLSRTSGQGAEEFKNEVVLIAKLQHRNLVRLLGFCLAGEEKLLVYQFIPNKSLNYFIFDKEKQGKLNWPMRYSIIKGIARGLLYLHEDSRPRIIHRDLKAGNILLDAEMNPKISDFGLARIVNVEKIEDDTSRVVGTYGYMAPEYAMHGQFSVKSDVYSFGILVLEIVSGKKISGKYKAFRGGDLLTHAWSSLIEGKAIEIIDPTLKDSYSSEEVTKCIQIGLWCAQENANERPIMSTIVLMLNNDTTTTNTIPTMSCPRSFYNSSRDSSVVSRINQQSTTTTTTTTTTISDLVTFSENQDTISEVYPR